MPRRSPYTKVVKTNQIRAAHVSGMGDVVFKGFQCLNSECLEFIFVRKVEIGGDFEIICPSCEEIYNRFDYCCFKCKKDLRNVDVKERPLDHTLPAVFLWPLTTENATLLCREHNSEKSDKWPSAYYSDDELKKLAVLTGVQYEVLTGQPHYNPEAIERLKSPGQVDDLLTKYAAYLQEIIKLRNRILQYENIDFFLSILQLMVVISKYFLLIFLFTPAIQRQNS